MVLVAAGVIWGWLQFSQDPPSAAAPASAAAPRVAAAPAARVLEAPSLAAPHRPSFDVVRINPTGDAVMAGRAAPNSTVIIQDGEREVGRVQADQRGEWVYVPNQPLPSGTRELSLTAKGADGAQQSSEQVVVLAVPERGKDLAGRPVSEPAQPLAMATPREGLGRSTVLQLPTATRTTDGKLALDVIDYDDSGPMVLAGRGKPGATVTVYLDNRPIGTAVVGGDGTWTLSPDLPVSPGRYTVRIDQLGADGRVASRIEMPFTRGEPSPQLASGATQVIVQPGNSLWRIARRTYGEGMRFTLVYDANKDQIRDPDLIYPGQLFVLPKTN
jgi:nucleoid-associated protein YgaU